MTESYKELCICFVVYKKKILARKVRNAFILPQVEGVFSMSKLASEIGIPLAGAVYDYVGDLTYKVGSGDVGGAQEKRLLNHHAGYHIKFYAIRVAVFIKPDGTGSWPVNGWHTIEKALAMVTTLPPTIKYNHIKYLLTILNLAIRKL